MESARRNRAGGEGAKWRLMAHCVALCLHRVLVDKAASRRLSKALTRPIARSDTLGDAGEAVGARCHAVYSE